MEELEEIQDPDNCNMQLRSGSGLTIPDHNNEKAEISNEDKNSKGKAAAVTRPTQPALNISQVIDVEETNQQKTEVPAITPQGMKKKTVSIPNTTTNRDGPKEKYLQLAFTKLASKVDIRQENISAMKTKSDQQFDILQNNNYKKPSDSNMIAIQSMLE